MSGYDDEHPIKAWQREAAAREIERLIKNPPVRRVPDPSVAYPETAASDKLGSTVAEAWMQLAMKHTKLSREEIMSRWGKEDHPPELSSQLVPRPLQLQRARMAKCPDLYRGAVIERDPIDCHALRSVKSFLAGRRRLLMLTGGKGTYKSGSACYALGQVEGSRYVDALELADVHQRDPDRWKALMNGHLVVLDDLNWEDARDGERAKFLAAWRKLVVNAYTRARRLIVTGNVVWEDFKLDESAGGYGVLVADRWDEAGIWIDVPGESKRREMRNSPHWTSRALGESDDSDDDD